MQWLLHMYGSEWLAWQATSLGMAKRFRAEISDEELTDILRPFATTKRWLSYPERHKDSVQRIQIVAHRLMIVKLKERLNDLAIISTTATKAFAIIGSEKQEEFRLTNEQLEDWCRTMSKRLRTMLRHVAQGLLKRTKWMEGLVQERPEGEKEEGEVETDEKSKASGSHEADEPAKPKGMEDDGDSSWLFGYSFEHHQAWRAKPKGVREWTKDIFCRSSEPTAVMMPRWGGRASRGH